MSCCTGGSLAPNPSWLSHNSRRLPDVDGVPQAAPNYPSQPHPEILRSSKELIRNIDKKLLFSRPHVLSATRVRENWFSGSPSMVRHYQNAVRPVNGLFSTCAACAQGCRPGRGGRRWRRATAGPEEPGIRAHPVASASEESLFSVRQDVFVIRHRVHIVTRFVGDRQAGGWRLQTGDRRYLLFAQ